MTWQIQVKNHMLYFHRFTLRSKYVLLFTQQTFLVSKTSLKRLEDVFSVTLFVFQDFFKTYLQYVFLKRLQDVFETCLQDVLQLGLQDVFKTSSRRVCKTSWNYVFKTSSRRLQDNKKRQKNVTMNTSSVRLHQDEWLLGNNSLAVPQKAELFTSLSIILP